MWQESRDEAEKGEEEAHAALLGPLRIQTLDRKTFFCAIACSQL